MEAKKQSPPFCLDTVTNIMNKAPFFHLMDSLIFGNTAVCSLILENTIHIIANVR
jgi:hypothetical protein